MARSKQYKRSTGQHGYRRGWRTLALTLGIFLATIPIAPSVTTDSVAAQPPEDGLQTAANRRLYRILIGRSEQARGNLIARMAPSPDEVHGNREVLIAATRTLLAKRKEHIADDSTKGQREETSESLLSLLPLIAGIHSSDAAELINQALAHPDANIAMAAMDAVGRSELKGCLAELTRQIKRSEFTDRYAFRFSLVRAMAQLHHPDAIVQLQRLQRQLDGQLQHEISQRLADADERDFGGDVEKFQKWKNLPSIGAFIDQVSLDVVPPKQTMKADQPIKDERIPLESVSSSSGQRPKLVRNQYYGIDLTAARMLFIIDCSGSMQEPAYYGTRLQRAKQELLQTINGLAPSTEFGIMVFDTTVQFYRNELLIATEENKLAAVAFVNRITLGDKTNTHAALVEATRFDDQLEAVFMLTDGQPTFGKTTRPDLIINEIVRRNRTCHLRFNTIGIGQIGNTATFLQKLAEETGGEYRQVP